MDRHSEPSLPERRGIAPPSTIVERSKVNILKWRPWWEVIYLNALNFPYLISPHQSQITMLKSTWRIAYAEAAQVHWDSRIVVNHESWNLSRTRCQGRHHSFIHSINHCLSLLCFSLHSSWAQIGIYDPGCCDIQFFVNQVRKEEEKMTPDELVFAPVSACDTKCRCVGMSQMALTNTNLKMWLYRPALECYICTYYVRTRLARKGCHWALKAVCAWKAWSTITTTSSGSPCGKNRFLILLRSKLCEK